MAHRNNFAGRLREKGSAIAIDLQDLRELVKEAVAEKLMSIRENAMSGAREAGLKVDGMIRRKPWASVAIAAGLGTVLALLLVARRRS